MWASLTSCGQSQDLELPDGVGSSRISNKTTGSLRGTGHVKSGESLRGRRVRREVEDFALSPSVPTGQFMQKRVRGSAATPAGHSILSPSLVPEDSSEHWLWRLWERFVGSRWRGFTL